MERGEKYRKRNANKMKQRERGGGGHREQREWKRAQIAENYKEKENIVRKMGRYRVDNL